VNGGATSCDSCAAGIYSGQTGTTVCSACSLGFISASGSGCTPSAAGNYSPLPAQCIACPAGRFSGTGANLNPNRAPYVRWERLPRKGLLFARRAQLERLPDQLVEYALHVLQVDLLLHRRPLTAPCVRRAHPPVATRALLLALFAPQASTPLTVAIPHPARARTAQQLS